MQMLDVHIPTTDRRALVLTRYAQPNAERGYWTNSARAPAQPPSKMIASQLSATAL